MTILTQPLRAFSERKESLDHDIEEVARHFGAERPRSIRDFADFSTTTIAEITFRRIDPLREPLQVADERLQSRLEALCETLRAKY
jgi:hypothetical protein